MTEPTPEAIEVIARQVCFEFCEGCREDSEAIVAFIRGAIHRDGTDADAIRESLGLRWDDFLGTPRQEPARRVVGEWQHLPD